jgi:peptidoglycan/xylan/chitin deacetylase (PgdA/CDA1 family)
MSSTVLRGGTRCPRQFAWLVAVLATIVLATGPLRAPATASAQTDCTVQFGPGMLTLRGLVGEAMGEPLDCELPTDSAGDTIQTTSTGTAWYSVGDNAETFTDGYHRWVLNPGGLMYWDSPQATPLLLDGLPDGPAVWTRAATCPVLYTHEVPVATAFRRFLSGLIQAGLRPTSLSLVDSYMSGQGTLPRGCVVLTFDDALASQLRNAVPVLAEFGMTATFFVMPAFADGRHQYLDASGIRALHDAGQTVGAHTCNHPSLTLLNFTALMAELSDCRHQIESIIGVPVRYFAYPNGAVNQAVLAATAQAGYRAAFTTRASGILSPNQPLLLPRIRYDVGEAVATVVRRITSAR